MPLTENNLVIHAKHYRDGYPLCWDQDDAGLFEGTWNDCEVTCVVCRAYMEED